MSRIIIKNSTTAGNIPSSLAVGELAINTADGKLYYSNGSIVKLLATSGSGGGGGGGTGTVTSVQLANGTGISLSGTNPITTAGTITITNSAPDQTVVLNSGTGISVTGTYPTFTIANTVNSSNFITTGSIGTTQTISGSLTINQNLTVLGSASVTYISESTLNIGTNLITVNTNTPAVRFGGLAVIDSGSSPLVSASFLYDSIQDEFLFVHKGTAGGALTSSIFLLGPETFNDLGNEIYITQNRIPKGTGIEHLNDSNISDNGTIVSINSNTQVTGSFTVTGSVEFNNLTTSSILSHVIMYNTSSGQLFYTASSAIGGGGATDTTAVEAYVWFLS